jgi:hypothetical protein
MRLAMASQQRAGAPLSAAFGAFFCLLLSLANHRVLCASIASSSKNGGFEFKHHDNDELREVLEGVQARCPDWARVYELPTKSVLGRPLLVIEMTDKPGIHEPRELLPARVVGRIGILH